MSDVVFDVRGVSYRYPRAARAAVTGIDLRVGATELVALIGPNGSGKTTLMRLLLGAMQPDAGTVHYHDEPVAAWPRDALAREIGVVTQAEEMAFPLTVRELVAMGRYPHLGAWRRESARDRTAIDTALARCEVADLADRPVHELSGGERQRARLARALAQEPRTLVFDEPTTSLDIAHEMSIFELLAELRADGVTILLVTHNINLAARYAGRLVLLQRGRIAAVGAADRVLTRDTIERVYGWPVRIGVEDGAPQVVPLRTPRSAADGEALAQ